jgi:hypothetical protein
VNDHSGGLRGRQLIDLNLASFKNLRCGTQLNFFAKFAPLAVKGF